MATRSIPTQPLCLRHDIGDIVKDRYTIQEVLGAGAFGTVYRVAERIGARTVVLACKEMHVMDDVQAGATQRQSALAMFQEEAFLLQTLRNAHIPAAYFESEKGGWPACPVCGRSFRGEASCPEHGCGLQLVNERYYLIMDFIEGLDLEETLLGNGGRPLGEPEVIDWALQVCDALKAVHEKGFSHRDIKPANIKIQEIGRQAMLIDFGLIKPSQVSGTYGTVLMRKSTGLGTLGYAPPSPQEQARPDARTDILALGMTMYRLLSGRDPSEQAQLDEMRRKSPRQINSTLSSAIDQIVQKAIQIDPDQRYRDVGQLESDLRAARYPVETICAHCGWAQRSLQQPDATVKCERCGRALLAAASSSPPVATPGARPAAPKPKRAAPRVNPHEARLKAIRAEVQGLALPAVMAQDARIAEIEAVLALVPRFAVGLPIELCPGCQAAKLIAVSGVPTGVCPLCQQAKLRRRSLTALKCPICREAEIQDRELAPGELFCPICRAVPLQEEFRRRFAGMGQDLWWNCPKCRCEFDVVRGNCATLVTVGSDPYGVGARHEGETLEFSQWAAMSGRGGNYAQCPACEAQFDAPDSQQLRLVYFKIDPFEVGRVCRDQTHSRAAWQRIAEGKNPAVADTQGTHHCPHCAAEFDVDRPHQTMTLVGEGSVMPDWARTLVHTPIALPVWYLQAAGKRSGHPGLLCPECGTEFDHVGNQYKLIHGARDNLKASIGRVLTIEDWQRHVRGAPTSEEARALNQEVKRLQAQREREITDLQSDISRRTAVLEEEFINNLKMSVREGYVPLFRMSVDMANDDLKQMSGSFIAVPLGDLHVPLRVGETLRWECPGNRCSVSFAQGKVLWSRVGRGELMVSSERVIFVQGGAAGPQTSNKVWQCTIDQIGGVELQQVEGSAVIVLRLESVGEWIGFEVGLTQWKLIFDGKGYDLTLTPQDLYTTLNLLKIP